MACSWQGCKQVAVILRNASLKAKTSYESEPVARAAISRFYYSAFLRAREWAEAHGYRALTSESTHRDLWRWVAVKTRLVAFQDKGYSQAHGDRTGADYDTRPLDPPFY